MTYLSFMWIKVFLITLLLTLTGCSTDIVSVEGQGFFVNHGILQLLGWVFFPRIMFIFFSAMTGGLFFWVGVLFIPRFMVAFWATTYYWDTNPILCILAWLIAIPSESAEKKTIIIRK